MKNILLFLLLLSSFANAQNKITLTLAEGSGGMTNPMTTAGDIIVGGASGTPTRLAMGTASQSIRVNAGGTALEYYTPSGTQTLQQTLDNGSTLTSSETIDVGANQLTVTGTTSGGAFKVTNTGGGIGKAVDFQSNGSYTLLSANTNGIAPAYLTVGNATTNTALDAVITDRGSTGTAANGIASRYTNYIEADDGSGVVASRFITTLTNAAIGSYASEITLQGATGAAANDYVTFGATTTDFKAKALTNYVSNYNNQTGTTYTLQSSDAGKILTFDNAADITLTVPTGLPVGFTCTVIQLGAGEAIFTASGTTINNRGGFDRTNGQYAMATITQRATNTFVTGGDMQ